MVAPTENGVILRSIVHKNKQGYKTILENSVIYNAAFVGITPAGAAYL